MLPESPLATTSPEVVRVHRLLKQLPDNEFVVWHRLQIHPEPGPDFWVLHNGRRGLFIKVATLTLAGARSFGQADLFGAAAGRPAAAEHEALLDFARAHGEQGSGAVAQVPALVAFPNLSLADLAALQAHAEIPAGVRWLGKETLAAGQIAADLVSYLADELSAEQIACLRQAFTPEVVVPERFTVRKPVQRNIAAQSTPYLLDFDQERVLKTDLELTGEGQSAVKDFSLRLVNGVAGSGKSLIIVYRARLLRQLYPDKALLGLTHNQPLIRDLRARYRLLNPDGRAVAWNTFNQWCRKLWPPKERWRNPASIGVREKVVRQVWHAHLADTAISEQMLLDEIDWIKDRLIFSEADYLAADRAGRGFALSETQRQRVYAACAAYQTELRRRGQIDWGDVPRKLWRWVKNGQVRLPHYDAVLVDEAQFFAPIWFELIRRTVKPGTGHLFLVADPTQGFLKRRQSWLASGLDVRGRVHHLKKSYRTTREIMDFATLLYRARLPDDDDDIVPPDLFDMPHGTVPTVIPLTSEQDEITRVANEVEQLIQQGIPRRQILIIHAEWQGVDRLIERLEKKLGAGAAVNPKNVDPGEAIRVCTLNAATGLESPIVFLSGVRALFEQEQSVRLSDGERNDLVRDNTRRLYMAITRAGQRLLLTYVGDLPEALQRLAAQSALS